MTNTNPENLIDSVENLNLGKEINQIKSLEEHNSFQQNEEKSLREKHGEQNLRHKEDMYLWIKAITEKFLIIILILCSFFLFQIRQEFFEENNKFLQHFICFAGFALLIALIKLVLNYYKSNSEKTNRFFNVIISIFLLMALSCIIDFKDLETLQTISPIIITIVGSTTATIIGLPFVVAKYTFKAKEDEEKKFR
jgi:hypothetical protein